MTEKTGFRYFHGYTRFAVLMLSVIALTFFSSNSLIFNFTVICMDDLEDEWTQSTTQINSLFSALAVGCLIGTLPISTLVQKYGIGTTITAYGTFSAIATLLFPLCATYLGYYAIFVIRVIQGIPTALSYPAMAQISAHWSTETGLGTFLATLSTCMQISSVFTMPVSGAFCTSPFGWRGAYYLHGVVSILIYGVFYIFYKDHPDQHSRVSTLELEKISKGKKHISRDKRVPYKAILMDSCVWSTWISTFGSNVGYMAFLLYGPTYLNKVLGLDVRATGWGTALPFLLSALGKISSGPISNRCTFLSVRGRLIFFTMLSQGLLAICLVVMSQTTSQLVAQIAYTGSIVASGIVAVGTYKGASMVARQHVHFVMAVVSFFMVSIGFLLPLAVAVLCPENVPEEWSRLFLWMAVLIVVASLPYCYFARDKPAQWTLATLPEKICPFDNPNEKKSEVLGFEETKE